MIWRWARGRVRDATFASHWAPPLTPFPTPQDSGPAHVFVSLNVVDRIDANAVRACLAGLPFLTAFEITNYSHADYDSLYANAHPQTWNAFRETCLPFHRHSHPRPGFECPPRPLPANKRCWRPCQDQPRKGYKPCAVSRLPT